MRTIRLSDMECLGECPQDQGQICVTTWYSHELGPVEHWHDRSDGDEKWTLYKWSRRASAVLEPWNGDTSAVVGKGRKVEVRP